MLFNGTLRFNLDPENTYPDEVIEALLNEAGLQELVDRESKAAALQAKMERRQIRKELRRSETKRFDFDQLNLFRNDQLKQAKLNKNRSKEDSNQGLYL